MTAHGQYIDFPVFAIVANAAKMQSVRAGRYEKASINKRNSLNINNITGGISRASFAASQR